MEHGQEGYSVRLRVPVHVDCTLYCFSVAVFQIRIRIRKFLGHPDLNLLNRGTDSDPSGSKTLISTVMLFLHGLLVVICEEWCKCTYIQRNKQKLLFDFLSVKNDINKPSKSNKQKRSTIITQKVKVASIWTSIYISLDHKGSEASYRRKNYLQNYRKLNSFWHSAAGSAWFVAGAGGEGLSGNSQNWFPFSGLAKPHWGPTNQHRRDSEVSKERKRKATIRRTYRLYCALLPLSAAINYF